MRIDVKLVHFMQYAPKGGQLLNAEHVCAVYGQSNASKYKRSELIN